MFGVCLIVPIGSFQCNSLSSKTIIIDEAHIQTILANQLFFLTFVCKYCLSMSCKEAVVLKLPQTLKLQGIPRDTLWCLFIV